MESLATNFIGAVRRATLLGRPHVVAPVTMIVPGVLNGTDGPILYTADEITRNVEAWNGMPITVGHPNQCIGSARSPAALDRSAIGTVLNARACGNRLCAEGWFDAERTKWLEPRIYSALSSGNPMELSVGVYIDQEPQAGTCNQRSYKAIARNLRPDHLAILPYQTGACSLRDGCGLNVYSKPDVARWLTEHAVVANADDPDDYLPLPTMNFDSP